jgi:cytochrome c-type biogenesis protein
VTGTVPVTYAFTLGLIAAVNPCGFPLLPAYLAHFAGDRADRGWVLRTARAVMAGACVTAGFVLAFGSAGLLVESGMILIIDWVPWLMILFGVAMVALGVLTFLGRSLRLPLPVIPFSTGRTALAMAGFGVAYATASLSCALPLFLAGVGGAFTRVGFLGGVATFVAYALGMGVFVTAASLIAAHVGVVALRRVRPVARVLPHVMAAVPVVVGLYLVYYWFSDLVAPLTTPTLSRLVDNVQSVVSAALSSSPLAGVVLGAIVVAGFVLIAAAARWHAFHPPMSQSEDRR